MKIIYTYFILNPPSHTNKILFDLNKMKNIIIQMKMVCAGQLVNLS